MKKRRNIHRLKLTNFELRVMVNVLNERRLKMNANGVDISKAETHIANINPFRYRSYYYDEETKLYYLQSRYYNPEVGRFINADDQSILNIELGFLSNNLFAYCDNNPIMNSDPMGLARWLINIKIVDWLIKIVDFAIVILAAFLVCLAAVKAQALVQKICSWFAKKSLKKKLEVLAFKLAGLIVEAIHTVVYKIADRVPEWALKFSTSAIAAVILDLIDLSPAELILTLLDKYDGDGKSGYIRFIKV